MSAVVTPSDVDHLGVLVGDPAADRVVALSTASVFADHSLLRTYWHADPTTIDSGLQAHLYTRPDDVFVVNAPPAALGTVSAAVDVNAEIWRRLTGMELASSRSRIVLAPAVLHAAAAYYRAGAVAFLAFVLDDALAGELRIDDSALLRQARATTRLMDKNVAMGVLAAHDVPRPVTHCWDDRTSPSQLDALPDGPSYVFKPAGGAAGIGVFPGGGRGASRDAVLEHVAELRRLGRLPRRFQIQEFVPGPLLGTTGRLRPDGRFDVLEVHGQEVDADGRFVGARWALAEQDRLRREVVPVYETLAGAADLPPLMCLDVVAGRVLEVNPRVTGSAAIAHVLRHEAALSARRAPGRIERIDVVSQFEIPPEAIRSGRILDVVETVRQRYGALVLPQGLNPFGRSRIVIVDDDAEGSARQLLHAELRR